MGIGNYILLPPVGFNWPGGGFRMHLISRTEGQLIESGGSICLGLKVIGVLCMYSFFNEN
jgi:hypothetical protein